MDGNQHLGRGDFRASRSWAPSYHRSAAVFCPVFLCCFFLARSAPAPKVGGWRNPPSALIPPWCCVQTAPEKVTSAELYLAAAVITHLNSHSVLAEMILPPNDVFPLLEQPQSSPGCGYLSLRTYFPSAKHRWHCYQVLNQSITSKMLFHSSLNLILATFAKLWYSSVLVGLKIFYLEMQGNIGWNPGPTSVAYEHITLCCKGEKSRCLMDHVFIKVLAGLGQLEVPAMWNAHSGIKLVIHCAPLFLAWGMWAAQGHPMVWQPGARRETRSQRA